MIDQKDGRPRAYSRRAAFFPVKQTQLPLPPGETRRDLVPLPHPDLLRAWHPARHAHAGSARARNRARDARARRIALPHPADERKAATRKTAARVLAGGDRIFHRWCERLGRSCAVRAMRVADARGRLLVRAKSSRSYGRVFAAGSLLGGMMFARLGRFAENGCDLDAVSHPRDRADLAR